MHSETSNNKPHRRAAVIFKINLLPALRPGKNHFLKESVLFSRCFLRLALPTFAQFPQNSPVSQCKNKDYHLKALSARAGPLCLQFPAHVLYLLEHVVDRPLMNRSPTHFTHSQGEYFSRKVRLARETIYARRKDTEGDPW